MPKILTQQEKDDRAAMLEKVNQERAARGLKPLKGLPREKAAGPADSTSEGGEHEAQLDPAVATKTRQVFFGLLERLFKVRYSQIPEERCQAFDTTLAAAANYEIANAQASPRKVLWGAVAVNATLLTLDAIEARRAERKEEAKKRDTKGETLPASVIEKKKPELDENVNGSSSDTDSVPAFVAPVKGGK